MVLGLQPRAGPWFSRNVTCPSLTPIHCPHPTGPMPASPTQTAGSPPQATYCILSKPLEDSTWRGSESWPGQRQDTRLPSHLSAGTCHGSLVTGSLTHLCSNPSQGCTLNLQPLGSSSILTGTMRPESSGLGPRHVN